jgi:deoxyribodipyrimidine photo-lyase
VFPTLLSEIEDRIQSIDPVRYAATRNYKDGAVTRLSPYISRGVISTKQVFNYILSLDLPWSDTEKLVQELAWRDYWQQVWIAKGDAINRDLKSPQHPVLHNDMPAVFLEPSTQIEAVDAGIRELKATGYMHNHMRMYVASIACNIAQAHWYRPAQWMYYHLLDGDWASNALSWQWVAGSNANKKYYANQANVNQFFNSNQRNSFLDASYEALASLPVPEFLKERLKLNLVTPLPKVNKPDLHHGRKTLIYNYYNIDPYWYQEDSDVQRVMLLEPSHFEQYPVSQKSIEFILKLGENITGLKLFIGEFEELQAIVGKDQLVFKEHPTNGHYQDKMEPRDWMFTVKGYYPSFFSFWKKCKKEINGR